jgi:hypothetical protein
VSSNDIDIEAEGCFRRRLGMKRKHSEMEDDFKGNDNKSIFTSLKEKLGFKSTQARGEEKTKKSIFSPLRDHNGSGEHNFSNDNGFSSFASTPLGANHSSKLTHTNRHRDELPRKRVKFDEENLIVSSITYQRQNALREFSDPQRDRKEESLLTKFINFTANLF